MEPSYFLRVAFLQCIFIFLPLHLAQATNGFYLLHAPRIWKSDGSWKVNQEAPLSKWVWVKTYDSAKECQNGMTHKALFWETPPSSKLPHASEMMLLFSLYSQCIASDDPRLKQ